MLNDISNIQRELSLIGNHLYLQSIKCSMYSKYLVDFVSYMLHYDFYHINLSSSYSPMDSQDDGWGGKSSLDKGRDSAAKSKPSRVKTFGRKGFFDCSKTKDK